LEEGEKMFEISQKATEMMKEFFKEKGVKASIRIMLQPGG
jgi:hypothetical protein